MTNKLFSFFTKFNQNKEQNLQQLISFMHLVPAAVCLIDQEGTVIAANEQISKLSGFADQSLEGINMSKYGLTHADIEELLRQEGNHKIIKDLVTKDIETVRVCISAQKIPDTQYILLSFESVPHQSYPEKMKKSYAFMVENYPFSVVVQDTRGTCLAWNKRSEELFGVSASKTVGLPLKNFLPPALTVALEVMDNEVKRTQQSKVGQEMTFKNQEGKEVVLRVAKIPSYIEGKLSALLTIFEDISARKKEETELLEKRNLLQAVIDNMPLGMYIRNEEGEMTFFNKQSQVILDELEGKYVNTPNTYQSEQEWKGYADRERQALEEGRIIDVPDERYKASTQGVH